MPAESSMRRGRACSSVMVIQLIFYLGFLFVFVQRHLVGDLFPVYEHNCYPYNLLPQKEELAIALEKMTKEGEAERDALNKEKEKHKVALLILGIEKDKEMQERARKAEMEMQERVERMEKEKIEELQEMKKEPSRQRRTSAKLPRKSTRLFSSNCRKKWRS